MFYGNAILTIFLAFSGVGGAGDGADSVRTEKIDTLTVLQAEQLLAERNAELRLARLACTEAEANARQARRWENPEVSGIYNLYNPLNSRWLDPGNDGEVDISVSQPLPIGRSHRIGRSDAELRASQADYDWTAFSLSMQMKRQLCELWAVQRRAALIGGELESVERGATAGNPAPGSALGTVGTPGYGGRVQNGIGRNAGTGRDGVRHRGA